MGFFSVFIGSEKYYFQGDLDDSECRQIEQLCINIFLNRNEVNTSNEIFRDLLLDISSTFCKEITPFAIKNVFRIK